MDKPPHMALVSRPMFLVLMDRQKATSLIIMYANAIGCREVK